VLILSILFYYYNHLLKLARVLVTDEDFSFGLLIPLVSVYVIYLKWPRLRSMPWIPSWFGLVIIFAGFLIYIFGELVAIFPMPMISFIVVLIGLVYLLGGWSVFRELAFPLFMLFLMIPLPSLLMKQISFPLQVISSRLAAMFLQAVQVPVVRQGNILDLGVRQLQVVEACSGLRYIISLSALGIIFCFFYQRTLWKATIIILAIVPAAVLANALRVTGMAFWPGLQGGFRHALSGWVIFMVCLALLSLVNVTLNYFFPPPPRRQADQSPPSPSFLQTPRSFAPYLFMAIVLFGFSCFLSSRLGEASPVRLTQSFDRFPLGLASWKGERSYLTPEMVRVVGADDYLEATFVNPQNETVSLYLAFFSRQAFRVGGTVHSPIHCLPGSGWTIQESKLIETRPGFPVRSLLIDRNGRRRLVFYWYLHRGRWLASEYSLRFHMGLSGMLARRNDAAIIRLMTPGDPNPSSARERLINFTNIIGPVLSQFIPN